MAEPAKPAPVDTVVHHHVHEHHHHHPPRERPYPIKDPAASYDALGRKQPKKIGFLEAARRLPWLAKTFEKVVPQTYVIVTGDRAMVVCPCGGAPAEGGWLPASLPRVRVNGMEPCPGDCGRWFVFDGHRVRVARAPH